MEDEGEIDSDYEDDDDLDDLSGDDDDGDDVIEEPKSKKQRPSNLRQVRELSKKKKGGKVKVFKNGKTKTKIEIEYEHEKPAAVARTIKNLNKKK